MRNVTMRTTAMLGTMGIAAMLGCDKTAAAPTVTAPSASAAPNVVGSVTSPVTPAASTSSAAGLAKTDTAKTGTCADVGSTPTWRYGLTATPLYDGTVVVIGGHQHDGSGSVKDVDVFDPATRKFSKGPPMHDARANHAAASIVDMHHVVVVGDALSIEAYDGVQRKWTTVGKNAQRVVSASATSMGPNALFVGGDFQYKGVLSGDALLVGFGPPVTSVRIPSGRLGDFATQVGNDDAAMFGGHDADNKAVPDLLFNGKTRLITEGTTTDARSLRLKSSSMPKGEYIQASPELVVTESAAYTWDATAKAWAKRATFGHKHTAGAAALLDKQVFVIGGLDAASAVGELCPL